MPSFDVVSEVDKHELKNAVDQSNREVTTRFDFKGTESVYVLSDSTVTMNTQSEFQLQQMLDILQIKLTKRGVDITCLEVQESELYMNSAKQDVLIREGLESVLAKKIVKMIKDRKLKVQAQIQGDQVRVTGKKRDDLQQVIQVLKAEDFDMPLQFENFRD
ncbi:MAG: YajQ family cyclic di-GMP-binding protein [Gammaproteobacteria bacterium]|nr:YajQ family cyclic di-GMP-binding protein [Gammaproteobacteria bacterium]